MVEQEVKSALRWIDNFFEICPEDILAFVPSLLSKVLPAMASEEDVVRQAAIRLNRSLMDFIESLPDEGLPDDSRGLPSDRNLTSAVKDMDGKSRRSSTPTFKTPQGLEQDFELKAEEETATRTPPPETTVKLPKPIATLDYATAVGSLTLHFLNEHEATREASLAWLIMLHRRAPSKVLATNDGTFPALLKTLSDPAEAVVTRDLQLLSQIAKNSDDNYFNSFMTNLLQLFCTDRKLLETRCNLIIRQLCVSLSAERIYKTLAVCLEKDEVTIISMRGSKTLTYDRTWSLLASWYKTSTTTSSPHLNWQICERGSEVQWSRKKDNLSLIRYSSPGATMQFPHSLCAC